MDGARPGPGNRGGAGAAGNGSGQAEDQEKGSGVRFPYGYDADVYVDKAVALLRENYPWVTRAHLNPRYRFSIEKENGAYEYIEYTKGRKGRETREVIPCYFEEMDAEEFIRYIASCSETRIVSENRIIDAYSVPFYPTDVSGDWHLEHYIFRKHATGDYTVSVQAGDRSAGAGRVFGIPRRCFEQPTFDRFLDEYAEVVPGGSFGLYKEDLIDDGQLKAFLEYTPRKPHPEVEVIELAERTVIGQYVFCGGDRDAPIKTNTWPVEEADRVELLWQTVKDRLNEIEPFVKKSDGVIPGYWGIMSGGFPESDFTPWRRYYKSGYYFAAVETVAAGDAEQALPSGDWKETIIPEGEFVVSEAVEEPYDAVFMEYVRTILPEMGYRLSGGVCEYIDAASGGLRLYFPVKKLP